MNNEISKRLHSTAQPLTVLQGVLELALLNAHTVEEYRECCRQAIEELRRVTGCFDQVRELLRRA
jgi:nitrate/nitrite-specific signal transduction histidine kinase